MRTKMSAFALVTAGASASLGLLAGGCDWRDFDDLKKDTPVLSVGAPSGFDESQSFGQFTLPVAPPTDGSVAARFLASAGTTLHLAVVDLDPAGRPHAENISYPLLETLHDFPVTALAEIPGTRLALLGVPTAIPSQLLTLALDPPYAPTAFITGGEPQLGIGIAAGNLGGGPAADLVALSPTALHVYVDGSAGADLSQVDAGPGDPCPIQLSSALLASDRTNRAVVLGQLLDSGVQIAIGTPSATGAGTVSIFTVDVASPAQAFTCARTLKPPSGEPADPLFGRALATGDFDHDGHLDLLVGSPPSAVYMYRGPITTTPTKVIVNPNPIGDGVGSFGKALAAFELDGKPGDEALVGDASAVEDGNAGAGNVHVYSGPMLEREIAPALAPHDPKAGDGYGSSVHGLRFCATPGVCTTLPLIGSGPKVFSYFTVGAADPRVK
jgi:hypothetical protein